MLATFSQYSYSICGLAFPISRRRGRRVDEVFGLLGEGWGSVSKLWSTMSKCTRSVYFDVGPIASKASACLFPGGAFNMVKGHSKVTH